MIYDLAIIGGGPAGAAAGVYAARKELKTIFIAKDFGGQSIVSEGVENWIGTIKISGPDLAKNLEAHLRAYAARVVDIKSGEKVVSVQRDAGSGFFAVTTDRGRYTAKTVLVTAGSARRKLTVPGAEKFENKGITYCASCDGPLFAGMDVAVIGGGNAGFETAAQLLAYCKSVTLIHKNDEFKADPVTVQKVLAHPKMKAMLGTNILEVKGDKFVTGLVYENKTSGGPKELPVQGIFAEIGSTPATDFLDDLVEMTPYKQIIVDPRNQRASIPGIWAAGDCTDGLYHQNNIAAGDAVKALEDIYLYLHAK
jgi:alkyl hydroperoxide reductase subunit F